MDERELKRASKFLTLLLRHKPETIGLSLDEKGWAAVSDLISYSKDNEIIFSEELLRRIVAACDKQRFEFDDEQTKIRCRQGHSITVDVDLEACEPPEYLYHGTAERFLKSILTKGLLKQSRQHVHLSPDEKTATSVGSRHGRVVILRVLSGQMYANGHEFFLSRNGVWLTDAVPIEYLEELSASS